MNRTSRRKLARAAALLVLVGAVGAWTTSRFRDWQEVENMTSEMKTICVGRLLIDLPHDAYVETGGVEIDSFNIAAFEEPYEEFQQRLENRERQIRSKPGRRAGRENMESASNVKTGDGLHGKVFVHGRTVSEGTAANGLELEHYRYESIATEAMVHANGISIDLSAHDGEDPAYIDRLPQLISQLVVNPANRIPSESGFCFDRAYVRDPLGAAQRERLMLYVLFPRHPDVALRLIYTAGIKPYRFGLLARSAEVRARRPLSERMRFATLRAAPRTLAGLAGEELLESVFEESGTLVYGFQWETQGKQDSVYTPHMVLEMRTGQTAQDTVPPSLSQDAALGVWDAITDSIRIRPAM